MTQNGIEHNLEKSPYIFSYDYDYQNISYYFSSERNLKKFSACLEENRKNIEMSLFNRFKIRMSHIEILSDIVLYKRIEHRGFYIVCDGGEIRWAVDLVFDGQKLLTGNYEEK